MKTRLSESGVSGQVLAGVLLIMLTLLLIVPAVVQWAQRGSRASSNDRQSTVALNLAEAAVERGYIEAKSSTSTIAAVFNGTQISGYHFDTTYKDVAGGTYRIYIASTSVSAHTITITGEGRDPTNNEVRAIQATFQNRTIYGPMLSQGDVKWPKGLCFFWGPMMSQANIILEDGVVANWYFPRKIAHADVYVSTSVTTTNQRDKTWPLPPNTDNVEWWSNSNTVPEMPVLDLTGMRNAANNTHTLNVYGARNSSTYTNSTNGYVMSGNATWSLSSNSYTTGGTPFSDTAHVGSYPTSCSGSNCYFCNPYNHPTAKTSRSGSTKYDWYWDGDVTLCGYWCNSGQSACNNSSGFYGNVTVIGNLTIDSPGEYSYTGNVPVNAWMEHTKLTANSYDSSATNEYPADNGYHKSESTFGFGSEAFGVPGTSGSWVSTVGIRGFTYVGGNLTIDNFMDFNGAIWVNGNVTAYNGSATTFCGVYYDENLSVSTLNVVLVRQSWLEVTPSKISWQ
jgi:hypothetical protein